jgi:hypothetical protein
MSHYLQNYFAVMCCLLITSLTSAGEVLFEDNFNQGLSDKWELIGLEEGKDYRIKDGALELRVQPGNLKKDTPMLQVVLPFVASDTVIASVDITIVDQFTQDGEFAALYLVDEDGREFAAKKQRVNRQLMFAPGNYVFKGKPGENDDGDLNNYDVKYSPAVLAAGAVRRRENTSTSSTRPLMKTPNNAALP